MVCLAVRQNLQLGFVVCGASMILVAVLSGGPPALPSWMTYQH